MCDLALNFEGQNTEADLNNADISEVCLKTIYGLAETTC